VVIFSPGNAKFELEDLVDMIGGPKIGLLHKNANIKTHEINKNKENLFIFL